MTAQQWRTDAEQLRRTHPVFDHLGARQVGPDQFEIWLVVSTSEGQSTTARTQIVAAESLPTLADLWAGAAWCEREASEGFDLQIGQTALLLLTSESDRGVLRQDRHLEPRQAPWPGSHEPTGKSRLTPLGRA